MSDDSDNEMPEVVSSVKMASEREIELRNMFSQKRQIREELKLKRKLKSEKFKHQKNEKQARQLLLEKATTASVMMLSPDSELKDSDVDIDIQSKTNDAVDFSDSNKKKSRQHTKIYPKFNVVVQPLTKIQNHRAAAAISFKEKRFAKVPRENLGSTLTSYQEKLLVKNT